MKLREILNDAQMKKIREIVKAVGTSIKKENTTKHKIFINLYKDLCAVFFLLDSGNKTYSQNSGDFEYKTFVEIPFFNLDKCTDTETVKWLKINNLDDEMTECRPLFELPEFNANYKQSGESKLYKMTEKLLNKLSKHSEFNIKLHKKYGARDYFFCSIIEDKNNFVRISSTDSCEMVTEYIKSDLIFVPDFPVIISPYAAKIYKATKSTSRADFFRTPIVFDHLNEKHKKVYGTEDKITFDNINIYRISVSRSSEEEEFHFTYPNPDVVTDAFSKTRSFIRLEPKHTKKILSSKCNEIERLMIDFNENNLFMLSENNSKIEEIINEKIKDAVISNVSEKSTNIYTLRVIEFLKFMKNFNEFDNCLTIYEELSKGIMAEYDLVNSNGTEKVVFYMAPVRPL